MGNKAPKLKFGPRGSPDPLVAPFEVGTSFLKDLNTSMIQPTDADRELTVEQKNIRVARVIDQLKSDASQGIYGTEEDLKARNLQFGANIWPESPMGDMVRNDSGVQVLRKGEEKQIKASELVVGDIVQLRAGDQVPADGMVIDSSPDFAVQEVELTGESLPAPKTPGMPVAATTKIESGNCKAIIIAVGQNTVVGETTHLIVPA
jgi:E1-E2 ATPase